MDGTADDADARSLRPIGWWARLLDQRITAAVARVLAAWSLDRLGWQVLDQTARAAPIDRATVVGALAPFAPPHDVEATIDALHRRGWLAPGPIAAAVAGGRAAIVLTGDGRAAHRAVSAAIAAFRERMSGGVTAEQYATTVATLRRMADNLAPPTDGATTP